MNKLIGFLLIFSAVGLLGFMSPQVQFYKKPRHERLYQLWKTDLEQLSKKPDFKKLLLNVSEVELNFTNPQVAEELDKLKVPIKTTPNTQYKITVDVIRWIEGNRYGYVLQHDVLDSSGDKQYEFGRTYKVGIFW